METVHTGLDGAHRVLTDEERFERMRSTENLKREITRLAGRLNAANHRFLVLIAGSALTRCSRGDARTARP